VKDAAKEEGATESSPPTSEDLSLAFELCHQILGLIYLTCGCAVAPAVVHPNVSWVAGWSSMSYGVCDTHSWLCRGAYVWRSRNGDVVTRAEWDAARDDAKPYLIGSDSRGYKKIYKYGGCSSCDLPLPTTVIEFAEDLTDRGVVPS